MGIQLNRGDFGDGRRGDPARRAVRRAIIWHLLTRRGPANRPGEDESPGDGVTETGTDPG
jgi:hypothetical protein